MAQQSDTVETQVERISIKEIKTLLNHAHLIKRAVFLHGKPGIGKSSIVKQVAEELGIDLRDVRLSLLDPVDLRGLPKVEDGATRWVPPIFLPREGKGILFLDEFGNCVPSIQSAALQLILDRRLGEYVLPDGWSVVAASNNVEDRANIFEMSTALNNRFFHADFPVPNYEEWLEWGAGIVHPAILAFIKLKPSMLFKFDPKAKDQAWPSPRSWQMASELLTISKDPSSVRFAVGSGANIEFEAFWRLRSRIPDPDKLFANPEAASIPEDISLQLVIASLVAERAVQKRTVETLDAACIIISRLPPEVGMMAMKIMVSVKDMAGLIFRCPHWKKLGSKWAKYITPGDT